MNKLLVAALCGIAMTCSPAHAYAEKLFIVNPASNTGNTFKMSNAFKKDFEAAGYDVELISPGDKCKAYLMLQKVKKIAPTFSPIFNTNFIELPLKTCRNATF